MLKPPFLATLIALLLAGLLAGPAAAQPAAAQPVAAQPAAAPTLANGFAAFWQAHDGARLFGAPLTAEIQVGTMTVQYCERARLEWHPDYPPGRQITLGRLGAELLGTQAFPRVAPPSSPAQRYFAATGHSIRGDLARFWQDQGGVPIFGYPLSEEVTEDGRTVQYFERARLEVHPELAGAGYAVLPAPLGGLALQASARGQGATAVSVEPPVVAEGHTVLIKALLAPGASVTGGTLGGHALAFTCCLPLTVAGAAQAEPWAVGGVESAGAVGPLALALTIQHADGSTEQVTRTITVESYPYPWLHDPCIGPLTSPTVRAAEHAQIDAVVAGRSGPPRWSGPFRPPLRGTLAVTSQFGERRACNNDPPYEIHLGIDYAANWGTPVYAPAAGQVVWARPLPLRGNTLILDHGAGVFTLYAHLSAFRVHEGQQVAPGDLVALVGSTGNALGPHLHWEVRAAGPAVLPPEWLARAFP